MQPDPELVEQYRQRIAEQPKVARSAYAMGYLAATIRELAQAHERNCASCSTCVHLREMLAFIFAFELNEAPPDFLRKIHGIGDDD
ncbi:hypothetical protein [Micromonospora sp. CB01531]|uniref:hypothetical protein n=1 Tax=Micromonospora sp. CB01531 TaxID=1718947 RepID=UPI00093F38EE|nr:hypothetical protein [Micromonospora sp. CB01531]OKI47220.1 hypothetical protein A6A27_10235 [Micromonospora sp. CB01531]